MGAWGSDSFENDDASDWAADFCDKPDQADLVTCLSAVANIADDEYLEAPDSSIGIAAAEVVAALKGAPSTSLPTDTRNCFSSLDLEPEPSLVALAAKAIARIRTDSELKELWDESENPDEWYQSVRSLEERLNR